MPDPASLRSDGRQLSPGMGGRLRVDWVAAFTPESVAAFSGIRTLATIKNPPVMGYVRQANIAHGPQQVNNAPAAPEKPPRACENPNLQNKVLEEQDAKWLDTGTTGTAGRADPAMATLGEVHRAENTGR